MINKQNGKSKKKEKNVLRWYHFFCASLGCVYDVTMCASVNPFRTAVPFWGQTTQSSSSLSPKRDCGPKRVNSFLYDVCTLFLATATGVSYVTAPWTQTAQFFCLTPASRWTQVYGKNNLVPSRRLREDGCEWVFLFSFVVFLCVGVSLNTKLSGSHLLEEKTLGNWRRVHHNGRNR